ncbi:single-stranded DNA-binding protein [Dellaglioa sp. BT-FLS60]
MNNMNIIGNMTRDPELTYSQNGIALLRGSVAVGRNFKNKSTGEYETDFINIKSFGKTAELIANRFKKGNQVAFSGRLETGSYENNQGNRVYTADLVVENITFLRTNSENNSQNNNQNTTNNNVSPSQKRPEDPFATNVEQTKLGGGNGLNARADSGTIEITDDDIPF